MNKITLRIRKHGVLVDYAQRTVYHTKALGYHVNYDGKKVSISEKNAFSKRVVELRLDER